MRPLSRPTAACAAVTAALAAGLLTSPARAEDVPTPPTTVAGVTLSAPRTTLTGMQLEALTVSVHLTSAAGVRAGDSCGIGDDAIPSATGVCLLVGTDDGVAVSRQADNWRMVPLALVSGTRQDGMWRGTTVLGAVNAGVWRPQAISTPELTVDDGVGHDVPASPAGLTSLAAFHLRGSDWPVVRIVPAPNPPPWHAFTARVTASLSQTGRRAVGLPIAMSNAFMCGEVFTDSSSDPVTRVPSGGGFPISSWRASDWCAAYGIDAAGQAAGRAFGSRFTPIAARVRAAPASTLVRRGTDVRVTGRYWPQNAATVVLQRLVGRTWHTVGQNFSRSSGRFAFTATPPRLGSNTYRVSVPDLVGERVRRGSSPSFVIRGR